MVGESEFPSTISLSLRTGIQVQAAVRIGEGGVRPRCVLIHGNPGYLEDWQRLAPLVSPYADVAMVDLPGFGSTLRPDASPESLGLVQLADHVIAVADALSWREPVYLLGHSHGGGVAQVAAAKWPDRVAGLVLMGTLGAPAQKTYRLLSLPGAEAIVEIFGVMLRAPGSRWICRSIMRQAMRDLFFPEPVPAEKVESEMALLSRRREILVAMVHVTLGNPCALLAETAREIRCPTLLLHGAEDATVPSSHARFIHERIVEAGGRSQWELLPGAGHMLIEYQARELAEHIRRFTTEPVARVASRRDP